MLAVSVFLFRAAFSQSCFEMFDLVSVKLVVVMVAGGK